MRRIIIALLCAVAVSVVILSYTAAGAQSETVANIFGDIGSFFDKTETQIFNDSGNDEQEDHPAIGETAETATEPQEENQKEICTKYIYGYSEMGQPLEAFIINGNGANDKVIFMDFAVHGFEDEYAGDGRVLVDLGYGLVDHYSEHPESLGDYKMVIVPCANPDGVVYGTNDLRAEEENAFGRCTYAGIDINRDFRADCFRAVESQALKRLMDEYPPSIYLNFHGWENSVLGDPDLIEILVPGLDLSRGNPDWYRTDDGFIMGFVKEYYGAKSALVELKNSDSVNKFQVIDAINCVISEA